MWRLWCKALGQNGTEYNKESNKIAIIRTVILATYMISNAFIVAGVVRHWNDNTAELHVELEVQER
jgi:hypothetical protein